VVTLSYLLDTNVISEPLRPFPNDAILDRLHQHEGELCIASVVWHELWYGCLRLPQSRRRDAIESYLEKVVAPAIPILAYDEAAAAWHATERARLEKIGPLPPFPDGQIAAIAAAKDMILVTRDVSDYLAFVNLRIEDWSAR
jgi:tRNA(fMet)-specific endonuclease VapC